MFEITITEIRTIEAPPGSVGKLASERIDRLKMTIDGELDIPTVIKAVTAPRRKRKGKVSA